MYRLSRSFKKCGKPLKMQRAFMQEGTEGATTRTKDWGDKERAAENVWAKHADSEKLKALRNLLEEQKKTTDAIKQELDKITEKTSK
ncbi:hypothetical protein O0I10_004620 [Lichtheimia ornata]|uniref:ATPase inhibitor, mitochondrial n=1 Tax=Lichtheimia ornata TaxID=688661 RepID=A0AAD7V6X7_9FUNG|nr:uncharacterized protein O0I10_004620 [Lichtheimia ornata]KAJ8659641.1 hypothetical protein O0I10_004620 [Lichtheimia ornata]